MTAEHQCCPYCNTNFSSSIFHPDQRICSKPECRRRWRNEYHRKKYYSDAEYHLVCIESNQKWRTQNSGYQRRYRQDHPAYVEKNRAGQKMRDRKRRVQDLVKNNLALDLKSIKADVWLVGSQLGHLVKNNLAISEVMICESVTGSRESPERSCKEHLSILHP
jgi:hypothetical protein